MKPIALTLLIALPLLLGPLPAAHAALFGADTYHECLLDELDEVETDEAAVLIANECLMAFPDMKLPEKSSSLLLGPDDSEECIEKYAAEHPSSVAAAMIREACYLLYPTLSPEEKEAL
ncbi:hypothetical protein [Methylococcus sp. EFPC2]|uniref:hypothetical protein n=1 Tax=Methylococcus sp. EFPC2 TaxID=2812648 RepID=UPI001967FBA8|nr:hypothetical protein [Methylococcus sp. EFPC2]QSA97463.1 hypothetical protein JWZ97_01025 [Methylococcus sp. EFPC2]